MNVNKDRVQEALHETVSHFAPKRAQPLCLTRDSHLLNEVGIDSPRMIDVILEIEERFGLTLEDHEVLNLQTFGELVDLVEVVPEKKNNKPGRVRGHAW